MSDITLTASIRSNLLSLQNTTKLLDSTSTRLSTGKRVNSALDNPNSFFTARGLSNRASDLTARKDSIGQSISLLQATDKSINAITSLVEQAKAVAQQAEEATPGGVTTTTGVSTVSSQAATLSGVTTISTEAATAATGDTSVIFSATATAGTGAIGTITSETTKQAFGATLVTDLAGAGAASLKEVETVTLTGDYVAGDEISIQIDSKTATKYVVDSDDLSADGTGSGTAANQTVILTNIAASLSTAIDAEVGGASSVAGTSSSGAVLTITATADSTGFTTVVDAANDVSVIESVGTASGGQTGSSLLSSASTFAATVGDMLTFTVGTVGSADATANFTITADSTIDDMLAAITNLDPKVTATFNTTSGEIEISASGGLEFAVTEASPFSITTTASASATGVEVDTLTISGDYIEGDVISVSAGLTTSANSDSYTVLASDIGANQTATLALVATGLAAEIDGGVSDVSAASTLGVITITSDTVNQIVETTVNTLGTDWAQTADASANVYEVETVTLSGTYVEGDEIAIDIDGTTNTYTVLSTDVAGSDAANQITIATNISSALNAADAVGSSEAIAVASGGTNVITFTAEVSNDAFVTTVTTTQAAGSALSEFQFGSGSGLLVSGASQSFDIAGDDTDLISASYGVTGGDTLTFTVTGGSGSTDTVAFTVGTKTVAELVTHISSTDSDVTASFNAGTNQIDISSGSGGTSLEFAGTDLAGFTFNDGTADISAGVSTFTSYQNADDTLIAAYGATPTDSLTLTYNGVATTFSVGNSTIAELVTAIGDVDADITAAFNTTSNQIDITSGVGGAGLTLANENGALLDDLVFNNGTSVIATGVEEVFQSEANGSDLVSTAYGAAATDILTVALTGGGTADISIGTKTIDELVSAIAAIDSAITVSFNDTSDKIEISTTTGSEITFSDNTGTAVTALGLENGTSALASGDATTFTDTSVAVTSGDLLTASFAGIAAGDILQIGTAAGGTSSFTVGTKTIADLVTAISASDSAVTASYNTTSQLIEISATDDSVVTFTNTTGDAIGDLGLTDGTNALTSGTGVTYGLTTTIASTELTALNDDFKSILEQIDTLLSDASYKGTNLLQGSNDFVVKFNADGSSSLTLTGLDLGVSSNTGLKFSLDSDGYDFTGTGIATALTDSQNAIDHLRSVASTFGTGLGIIQTRESFTTELVNVLQSGSDKLVNANLEEESANMLALQTRQSLGIQSLSIANQSQQSILSLFR